MKTTYELCLLSATVFSIVFNFIDFKPVLLLENDVAIHTANFSGDNSSTSNKKISKRCRDSMQCKQSTHTSMDSITAPYIVTHNIPT